MLRVFERATHDRDFLLNQVAADCRQIIGNAGGGGMRAVSGAERIVDINFGQRGKLLREFGIVLFLFLVETDVLDQHHIAVLQRSGQRLRAFTDDIGRHFNFLTERLGEVGCHRSQRIFHVKLALRTAQMGAKDYSGILRNQITDGFERFVNALGITDVAFGIERNIEIAAHQNALALHVDVFHGLFVQIIHFRWHLVFVKNMSVTDFIICENFGFFKRFRDKSG